MYITASNFSEPKSLLKTIEVKGTAAISVTNGLVQPAETASCSNAENNELEPLLSMQGAFKQHLVFPVAQDKKNRNQTEIT